MKYAILIVAALILAPHAQAGSLLMGEECSVVQKGRKAVYGGAYISPAALGLTCEEMKNYSSANEMIHISLLPLTSAVMMMGGFREAALAELAALGISTPAVLGVTVLAATGYVALYVIVKADMAECERMDQRKLKEALMTELEQKNGLQGSTRTTFSVKKGK